LAEQGKEDTFLDLVNFLNDRYRIALKESKESFQKLESELSITLTPTRWRLVKMTALSKEVTLIVQSLMHKESQVASPAHPPRRNGKIKDLDLEVKMHLLDIPRS
jgi:hypothetical protein